MSKVFVVQENNRIDYSDAERYGDVVFLTAEEFKSTRGSLRNEAMLTQVRVKMSGYNPSEDYLLLTGNPIMIGYVFHVALTKGKSITCLQWDRFTNNYKPVVFDKP